MKPIAWQRGDGFSFISDESKRKYPYRSRDYTIPLYAATSESRSTIIEDVAKHIEAAPLTYAGPDPRGVQDMRTLIVWAIRDMKGKP